ncbi:MAG: AAA family ATPase [Rhodospirillales bacterium]|nr:AAA family ATPase [Rhodospirillales bacterium]
MSTPPPTSPTSARQRAFAGFVADETSRTTVTRAARAVGLADVEVTVATLEDTVRLLRQACTPKLLLVDVAGRSDPVADLAELSDVCDEGTNVIALGDVNDVHLFRQLVSCGVQDYLLKPVTVDDVAGTLTRARHAPEAEAKPADIGRLIAVVGTRGGVGATTVAVNIAAVLAREPGRRVALVDFDLFFGNCSLALELEVGRGFREALENPSRIDALFIERAMVRVEENLFVLSAEESLENRVVLDPKPLELLLNHLRRDFTHIVIDLPRFAARTQLSLITAPAAVAIVSDPTLVGMRDTLRLHTFFKKYAAQTDLSVVLNRCGALRGAELGIKDFEQGIEARVSHVIPFDARLFASSMTSAKPVVKLKARSKPCAGLEALAAQLGGPAAAALAVPRWKRWLGMTT